MWISVRLPRWPVSGPGGLFPPRGRRQLSQLTGQQTETDQRQPNHSGEPDADHNAGAQPL